MLGEVEYGDIVVIDRKTDRERTFAVEFIESLKYNVLTQSLFDEKELSEDIFWVKRVIGKPGDVIEFYQGKVYRNGELLTENYIMTQDVSTYPEGCQFIVKEGCIFVMGDNRNESMDSRMLAMYGEQIEIDHIVGKLISK
jgi:signal peptidase I